MTKPTTLAAGNFSSETLVPQNTDGGAMVFSSTYNVPGSTAASTIIGFLRFRTNDRVQINRIWNDDLDTGTTVTYDVGYAYDDNAVAGADDPNAFISGQSAQAAFTLGPSSASFQKLSYDFVAAGDGYVIVTITAGPTTTAGDIIIEGVVGRS